MVFLASMLLRDLRRAGGSSICGLDPPLCRVFSTNIVHSLIADTPSLFLAAASPNCVIDEGPAILLFYQA